VATGTQNGKSGQEELKHEMIRQGKMKFHQYWKQREGNARWRIWDKLNPHNRAQVDVITLYFIGSTGDWKFLLLM
jgi:hypothetical protein